MHSIVLAALPGTGGVKNVVATAVIRFFNITSAVSGWIEKAASLTFESADWRCTGVLIITHVTLCHCVTFVMTNTTILNHQHCFLLWILILLCICICIRRGGLQYIYITNHYWPGRSPEYIHCHHIEHLENDTM